MFNLLDFLFPKRCFSCGKFGSYLCVSCQKLLEPVENLVCPVCERPSIGGQTHPFCQTKYSLDGLISCFFYRGIIKDLIKQLKYRCLYDYAKEVSSLMIRIIRLDDHRGQLKIFNNFLEQKPIVAPVPLHKKRENWRGFNQSAILGKFLSDGLDLGFCEGLLIRREQRKLQVELKGKERLRNVKGAFRINKKFLPATSYKLPAVLLIDDVWTTGATMRECGFVLKKAKVSNVWALSLAR